MGATWRAWIIAVTISIQPIAAYADCRAHSPGYSAALIEAVLAKDFISWPHADQ